MNTNSNLKFEVYKSELCLTTLVWTLHVCTGNGSVWCAGQCFQTSGES